MQLYWLNLTYACGGIFVERGKVCSTAPIFHWMTSKSLEEVLAIVVSYGHFISIEKIWEGD